MFDYPLPHATSREYRLLGVSPAASAEEVIEAKNAVVGNLQAKKDAATRRLGESSTGSEQADAGDERVRAARRELDDLAEQLNLINNANLSGADERRKHDEAHPPSQLLKIADCAPVVFGNRRLLLGLVRRSVAAHLEERGASIFHPGDLSRTDFTADHTPHPLLDGGTR